MRLKLLLSCSMAVAMMLDYIGEKDAAVAIEGAVEGLLKSGEISGLGTGAHGTDEVGDMVVNQLTGANASL